MTLHFADDHLTVHVGDCREVLATLPAESVHCVVTSPPYWGLRDYGTATWEGGEDGCDHLDPTRGKSSTYKTTADKRPEAAANLFGTAYRETCRKCGARRIDAQLGLEATPEEYVANMVAVFREVRRVLRADGTVWLNIGDSYATGTATPSKPTADTDVGYWNNADKLGRSRIDGRSSGLKPKDLVGIPWRLAFALQADGWVLRSDVVWSKPNPMPESVTDRPTKAHEMVFLLSKGKWIGPERGRFADISDGDARWLAMFLDTEGSLVVKRVERNGRRRYGLQIMFASTSRALVDRARSIVGQGTVLERDGQNAPMFYYQLSNRAARDLLYRVYPFLIVKPRQARIGIALQDRLATKGQKRPGGYRSDEHSDWLERAWLAMKSLNHFGDPDISWAPEPIYGRWTAQPYYYDADAVREAAEYGFRPTRGGDIFDRVGDGARGPTKTPGVITHGGDPSTGRNLRTVWTIATQPYPGAHFATFPEKLVEPCIKAGTSERGVCPECGAPWVRVVEVGELQTESGRPPKLVQPVKRDSSLSAWSSPGGKVEGVVPNAFRERTTTGWRASCAHDAEPVPATVLDPFGGSGTTARVANRLGRRAILIDLSADYIDQAMERNAQTPLGLLG